MQTIRETLLRIGAIILAAVIFIIDTATSLEIAVAVLYVTVILISVAVFSRRGVLGIALTCMFLTAVSFLISHFGDIATPAFTRCLVSLVAITITTVFALKNKSANDELQVQLKQLSQTHDAIIVRTLDGTITRWNQGAEKLYGWSQKEAKGKNLHELLRTRFPLPMKDIMTTLLDAGTWEGELVVYRRDGAPITATCRCALLRDKHDRPIGILATHNDVTERNQAIEALRRSEAFLAGAQRISRTSSIGIKVPRGDIYCSEEALRLFEFSPDERPSLERILQKTHPDDRAVIERSFADALRMEPRLDLEFRLSMPDGRIKYVHMLAHPVMDNTGNCEYVGALMEVTASKIAEEALHRSQVELAHVTRVTTLGELVASIAHEVNQPLSAIAANGEACLHWLKHDEPDLQEVRDGIARVLSEVRRASDVILRIRALSRKSDPQYAPLDLREVVEEALALVQREAAHNSVILSAALTTETLAVQGDRVQLQQVIINLVMNGMQAMGGCPGDKRRLRVRLQRSDQGDPLLAVMDTGPGIDPQVKSKLFNPFFTTKAEGMGMGLPICRSIIERHGGRIWADDQARAGAAFYFSLPNLVEPVDTVLAHEAPTFARDQR
ncbi:PAS domain-containing sensor histidine kinase [Zestomonas carbonaria]|uniref:histidine kinase n=1 Tax=Zestomonas carbonaria TaxID=2762745 RepID=A0A7U7EP31_9GAMM|nr:ATP-binding protein [Pseudomonas carbonaria]CAD5108557.1 Adaptive-response sensory-kinase SasA [Pseudomonas carbonaria]